MQEYIVEIFNQTFMKVAEVGPCLHEKAQEHAKNFKDNGFLVTITEKELIGVDESFV